MRDRAEDIFNNYLPAAHLKDDQWRAIEALLKGNRVLVVQPTGWGKSIVYFIAAKLFKSQNKGLTIIISPLLALIRNQLEVAHQMGLAAYTINSDNPEDWEEINNAISHNNCDVLIVAPERLQNEEFVTNTLTRIQQRTGIGLIVVDEAHCISDWGHDFRLDYKKIVRFVNTLQQYVPMLATTATANERVANDIKAQLGNSILEIRGSLMRSNLNLKIVNTPDTASKLGWLLEHLKNNELRGTGIIYCTTRKETETVAAWLNSNDISAEAYHREIGTNEDKMELENKLINNEIKVLVSTVALGMGFDKKDVRFIIHYNMPSSLIRYYQEIGRAGRDGLDAEVILLYSSSDFYPLNQMISSSFTNSKEYEKVLQVIHNNPGSFNDIMKNYNISYNQLKKIIEVLEADGLIYKQKTKYHRSLNSIQQTFLQNQTILDTKTDELDLMNQFANLTNECLMNFLIKHLGESQEVQCGKCMNCTQERSSLYVISHKNVELAANYIKNFALIIEPKKSWPSGGVEGLKGRIPERSKPLEGRALSLYKNDGIGMLVWKNRYEDYSFSDELVNYCAEYIKSNYLALNSPKWLVTVPSLRNPELLDNFTKRISKKLNIPYHQILYKVEHSEEQKFMKNSHKRVENIKDSFDIIGTPLDGNVLLIDDIMNSGWTFAICAKKLLEAGCNSVTPLALSRT